MNIEKLMPWREKSQTPAMREDFFDPFVTFRREVQRMMDDFVDGFDNGGLATMKRLERQCAGRRYRRNRKGNGDYGGNAGTR